MYTYFLFIMLLFFKENDETWYGWYGVEDETQVCLDKKWEVSSKENNRELHGKEVLQQALLSSRGNTVDYSLDWEGV